MNPYRNLPSLDRLLERPELTDAIAQFGRTSVRDAGRRLLERTRASIGKRTAAGASEAAPDLPSLLTALLAELQHQLDQRHGRGRTHQSGPSAFVSCRAASHARGGRGLQQPGV